MAQGMGQSSKFFLSLTKRNHRNKLINKKHIVKHTDRIWNETNYKDSLNIFLADNDMHKSNEQQNILLW